MKQSATHQNKQLLKTTSVRPLWRNTDFLLLWSGQTVSTLGSKVSQLAFPLLILALTHSPTITGLMIATELLPYLLFSLPVGALIDRWNRKRVMLVSDSVRFLVMAAVPLAFAIGHLNVTLLYLIAFIEGTANVLFGIAQISSLPQVVSPIQLSRAYSLNEISEFLARLFGPGLCAFIIGLARTTLAGAVLAYLVDSISYLLSVLSLCFVRVPFQEKRPEEHYSEPTQRSLWADIVEGLRFLWMHARLRIMVLVTATVNFLQSSISLAVILLAQERLHVSIFLLSLIFTAGGVGGLVGGLVAPWVRAQLRFGHIVIVSVIVWAMAALLLTIGQSAWILMIGMAMSDFIWPIYAVVLVSYRLEETPDRLQGRVTSAFRVVSYGSEPLGAALGGLLLSPLGPTAVLGLITICLAITALGAGCTSLRKG